MQARVIVLSVFRESDTRALATVQCLKSNAVLKCLVRNCPSNLQKDNHATLCVCAYKPPFLEVNLEQNLEVKWEPKLEGGSLQHTRKRQFFTEIEQ
jgi:hypothetical protein